MSQDPFVQPDVQAEPAADGLEGSGIVRPERMNKK